MGSLVRIMIFVWMSVCLMVVHGDICSDVVYKDMPMKSCLINTHDDLATIPDTAALELQFEQLNTVDFNQFALDTPSLTYLVFHMTYLNYVELKGAMNGLSAPDLETLTVKRDLDRDGNSLYLDAESFARLESVETLNLNGIGIGTIDPRAFRGLYSLDVLDLSENYFVEVPEGALQDCYNITILRLQDNFITPANLMENSFTGPTDLHWLNLENNKINYLPNNRFIHSEALSILVLTNNGIAFAEEQAFNGLTNLHYLSLSNNKFSFVPSAAFKPIPYLYSLDLSLNELNDLHDDDFAGLTELEILYLQYTNLGDVSGDSFRGLGKLRELHLKGNQIQTIDASTFQHMQEMMNIDLSDNKLSQISVDTFSVMPSLKVLNLGDNELRQLEEGTFDPLDTLDELYLSENRWNCSCELLWMFQWIHDNEDRLTNEHQLYTIKCSIPEEYQHYTFYNLRFSFVMGCQEDMTELDITTASQSQAGEDEGLSSKQLTGIIAGVVVFFILLVFVILIVVFVHRKKHRFWKPARSEVPSSRTQEQLDREQRLARHRTPSWCKEPAPALPPRDASTPIPHPPPSAPTPEQENKANEVFAFDNMALETSMMSKNGMSPSKSSSNGGAPSPGYRVPSPTYGVQAVPAGPRDHTQPGDVHINVDINKNATGSQHGY